MGKNHHAKDNKNSDLYKLFALFYLMNSLINKKNPKDMNNNFNKNINQNDESNDKEYLSSEDKPYIAVNTDSLIESYKKNLSGSLEKADIDDIPEEHEADDFSEDYKISVISEVLPLCENMVHTSPASKEQIIVKIPVVLAECTAAINIDSSVKLDDNIIEINRISKHVYLSQCKLAPDTEKNSIHTSILFIDGFINENIECFSKESADNDILKYITFNIPFKCAAGISFNTSPEFKWNEPQNEAEILDQNHKQSSNVLEFFNEKVFCKLTRAEIDGTEFFENKADTVCPLITEKAVLFLTIELLQKQHVKIS